MKKIFVLLVIVLLTPCVNNATSLVTQQLEPVVTGDVCAFQDYYLTFEDATTSKEIIITDANTSRILSANSIKGEEYQIILPSNIENVNVIVNEYLANGEIETEVFPLSINICGYNQNKEDFVITTQDRFSLAGNTVDMYLENQENIKSVSASSLGGKKQNLEFNNQRYTLPLVEGENIYQINITYNDGSVRNYELDVDTTNSVLSSRIIEPEEVKKRSKIDFKWLTITLVLFVIFLVLKVLHKKAKKKEKKYLRYVKKRRG